MLFVLSRAYNLSVLGIPVRKLTSSRYSLQEQQGEQHPLARQGKIKHRWQLIISLFLVKDIPFVMAVLKE